MKTLCKSIFALAAVALVSTSAAKADLTFYLTGSTAYRAATVNALAHLFGSSAKANYIGKNLPGANDSVWQGTISSASSLGTVTVACHFNGSLTGVQGLNGTSYTFLNFDSSRTGNSVTASGQANFISPFGLQPSASGGFQYGNESSGQSYTAFISAYNAAHSSTPINTTVTTASAGLSDAFYTTAQSLYPGFTASVNDTTVGILPFVFIKSAANTGDTDYAAYQRITNASSLAIQSLFAGGFTNASLFTGVAGDVAKTVYAIGRDNDSGTRIAAFAESGFGIGNAPTQYEILSSGGSDGPTAPIISFNNGGSPQTQVNFPNVGGGYSSGGNVASALEGPNWDTAIGGYAISYLGAADADGAVSAGFNVTTVSTSGGTSYTAASASGISVGEKVYVDSVTTSSGAVSNVSGTTITVNFTLPASGSHAIAVDTLPSTYARPASLTFNGVALSQATVNNGQYQFWEYEHFLTPSTISGNAAAFATALSNQLSGTDYNVAGYSLSSMNTGSGTTAKSGEGQVINIQ